MSGYKEVINPLIEKAAGTRLNLLDKRASADIATLKNLNAEAICKSSIANIQRKFGVQNLIARNGFMRRNSPDR
jgi:hypothetical protein